MNQEKAREFFSAYFEGTLERGLKQTLEQRLKADAQLQAEYKAFERTMQELDLLKFEEIEVPIYLSDRVATRVENARSAKKPSPFSILFPRFAFGALAVIAVVGAGIGLFTHGNRSSSTAGLLDSPSEVAPVAWPSETVSAVVSPTNPHTVVVHYSSASDRKVQVLDDQGKVLKAYDLTANQQLSDVELKNDNEKAAVFEIKVMDNGPDEFIVTPGSSRSADQSATGQNQTGTVLEFSRALADYFQIPVVLKPLVNEKSVSWTLQNSADSKSVAEKVLDGTGYQVTLPSTGALTISG